jgi:hypothetical protein
VLPGTVTWQIQAQNKLLQRRAAGIATYFFVLEDATRSGNVFDLVQREHALFVSLATHTHNKHIVFSAS